MRAYEQSHPWMTFSVNLSKAPANLWVSLGECNALCRAISMLPLLPETRHTIEQINLARGIIATKKYGRFSLDESQMIKMFDNRLELTPSKKYLAQEIDNMLSGIKSAEAYYGGGDENPLTPDMIKNFNMLVLDRLALPPGMEPGRFRDKGGAVPVSTVIPAPAEDCEYLLEQLCTWLSGSTFSSSSKRSVIYGIIKTVLAHIYLKWIMPFTDGNHRTIAITDYYLLRSAGVPGPAAHLLDVFFSDTISEYEYQIKKAGEKDGKIQPFLMYAVQGLRDSLKGFFLEMESKLCDNLWESFIKEKFSNKTSSSDQRKCRLAIELAKIPEPVQVAKIRDIIPWAATAYAGKTYKTLTRDAAELVMQGFFEKTEKGMKARKELINSFEEKELEY